MHTQDRVVRRRLLALLLAAALATSAAAHLDPRRPSEDAAADMTDTLRRARLEEELVHGEVSAGMLAEFRTALESCREERSR